MKVNAEKFRHRLPELERYVREKHRMGAKIEELPGLATMYTGIPIYACCKFVSEIFGSTPELENTTEIIRRFYGYVD